jgi:hypothetical protein
MVEPHFRSRETIIHEALTTKARDEVGWLLSLSRNPKDQPRINDAARFLYDTCMVLGLDAEDFANVLLSHSRVITMGNLFPDAETMARAQAALDQARIEAVVHPAAIGAKS